MVTEIKKLPENCKGFAGAEGKKYIVHEMISVEAYQIMEELRLEMETGNSAGDLVKLQGKAIGHLQKNNIYDASVCLYNALNISERVMTRRYPAWLLTLTLFVRPEGADLSRWDESEAALYIEDWNAAGYGMDSLFFLYQDCQATFGTAFMPNSPDTSQEQPENQSPDQKEPAQVE